MSSVSPTTNQTGPNVAPTDPGRTLGIVGLVLSFGGLVGLIISIVAFKQSKQAGFDNGLAKGGIVVGSIVTVLSVVWVVAAFALAASGLPAQQ